jgi:hypothetical protein
MTTETAIASHETGAAKCFGRAGRDDFACAAIRVSRAPPSAIAASRQVL